MHTTTKLKQKQVKQQPRIHTTQSLNMCEYSLNLELLFASMKNGLQEHVHKTTDQFAHLLLCYWCMPVHVNAQGRVELGLKVDLAFSGSDLHVPITISIAISITFQSCLKLSR